MAEAASETGRTSDPVAGLSLAGASLLSILAMAHHPTGYGAEPALARGVHAAMIIFVVVSFAGYARLSVRLGLHRFANLLALCLYGAGAIGNLIAAITNGFIVPAIYENGVRGDVLRLCWELNQACAYGAVYATSAAVLVWSISLVRIPGVARIAGFIGLAAAIAPAVALAAGALAMNIAGAFIVYALQAAFGVMAGALLMRRDQ